MNMITWIRNLIVEYGGINVLIMAITIILTNLIKKPIKDKADKLAETAKTLLGVDLDKSVITSNIVYIPVGVAFILYFFYSLILVGFKFALIDWGGLVSNALVYGMLSVSLFDIIKSKLNAYKSKDKYEEVKNQLNEAKQTVEETKDLEMQREDDIEIVAEPISDTPIVEDEHDLLVEEEIVEKEIVEPIQNIKKENVI